ncbi:MAG: DUF2254 domain-containing protein [Verrucomicrobiota bacterium]|nr:DUF2254 domain-containing protein [Verrucomicrobiota bacterium]
MRKLWIQLRSSLWFIPTLLVLAAVVLAIGLIELDLALGDSLGWGKLRPFFGSSAEGARGMLTAIASSMITVAGVAFSVTIVTLSLASTQYTPRILRNFMRDRANQSVLGVFVGIHVYCLIVLRTIRAEQGGVPGFVPLLAVFCGILLALLSIGCLIFFIHHVAASIQASFILEVITRETLAAIDALYPRPLEVATEPDNVAAEPRRGAWLPVAAPETGYIQNIDGEGLLAFAREHDLIVRMERGVGDFVVEDAPLISATRPLDAGAAAKARALFVIGDFRTVEQDAGFGIRQIVEIAMKALSPGVNDTSTAVSCLDYLSAILSRFAGRSLEPLAGDERAEQHRVIAPAASFADYVAKSLDEIRLSASGNVSILLQMLCLIGRVASVTRDSQRTQVLIEHARIIAELADHSVRAPYDRGRINTELASVRDVLNAAEHLPLLTVTG